MKNKKTIYFAIFLIIGIGLFAGVIWESGIGNIIHTLLRFSLWKFFFLVSISIFNFWLFSKRWEVIVKVLYPEKKIPSSAFFLDRLAGYAISYVTPSAQLGGEPLRIMMLQEEGVPKNLATSSTIIDKALEISTLIIFISLGVFIASFDPSFNFDTKLIMIAIMVLLLLLVAWFLYATLKQIGFFTSIIKLLHLKRFKSLENLENKMFAFETEMNTFYQKNPWTVIKLLFLNLLMISFMLFEHFITAYFLGVRLTFVQTFLISTIPYIAYLMPIPGGLGILESGTATIFLILGVNINAFVFIFILRMRDFVFVILGFIRGYQKGFKILKKEFKKDYKR